MPHSTLQQILRKGCIRGTAIKIPKRNIKVLGGGKVTIQACYRFQIMFNYHHPTYVDFFIVNEMGLSDKSIDLILGKDFLDKTGAVQDHSARKLVLYHPQRTTYRKEYNGKGQRDPQSNMVHTPMSSNSVNRPNERINQEQRTRSNGNQDITSNKGSTNRQTPSVPAYKTNKQSQLLENVKERYNQKRKNAQAVQNMHEKDGQQPSVDRPVVSWDKLSTENLTESEAEQLKGMLHDNEAAFVKSDNKIGFCDILPLKIQLKDPNMVPIKKQQYRQSPHVIQSAQEQMDQYIADGIIEETHSEWNSPVLILPKGLKKSHKHVQTDKNPKRAYRLVTDLRALNEVILKDNYIVPNIEDLIDKICSTYKDREDCPQFFSKLDLKNGYFQLALHEDSKKYTAFTWNGTKYHYNRLPMGLSCSPGNFCQIINKILQPYLGKTVICYLDDILIYSRNFTQHLKDVAAVLQELGKANLLLSANKCDFAKPCAEFLGFTFSADGYRPAEKHVDAISSYPRPKTVKQLRTFLGLVNYFRKFLQKRAEICAPLNALTRKNAVFHWSKQCEESFQQIKIMFATQPVLQYPKFNQEFYLACDASTISIGACLSQKNKDGHFMPVAYCGRSLSKHEKNYTITRLELLATVFAITYFRVYLEGRKFTLITDHSPLTSILKSKTLTPQMARFSLIIQGYDFDIMHTKGLLNSAADALSRRPYNTTHTQADDIINEFPYCPHDNPSTEEVNSMTESNLDKENAPVVALVQTRNKHRLKTFQKLENAQLQRNSLIGKEDLTSSWDMLEKMSNNKKSELEDVLVSPDSTEVSQRRETRQEKEGQRDSVTSQNEEPNATQQKWDNKNSKSKTEREHFSKEERHTLKDTSHQYQEAEDISSTMVPEEEEVSTDKVRKKEMIQRSQPPELQQQHEETDTEDEDNQPLHHQHNLRSKGYDHRFRDQVEAQTNNHKKIQNKNENQQKLELDLKTVIEKQQIDTYYGPLYKYLNEGSLPNDPAEANKILAMEYQ